MEYQQGKNEDLYQDSKRCLELFPSIGTVYLLNGVSANQTKRYSEAFEVLSVGKEMVYNDKAISAEFLGQLGEASFGLKEYTQGKAYYKKALELDPNSQLIEKQLRVSLGECKHGFGRSGIIDETSGSTSAKRISILRYVWLGTFPKEGICECKN